MCGQSNVFSRLTDGPFLLDRGRTTMQSAGWKPAGLWVSVNNGWERSFPEWGGADPYQSEIVLSDKANLLTLGTLDEIDEFHSEFNGDGLDQRDDPLQRLSMTIDWATVASMWDGVLVPIEAHIYQRLGHLHWARAWDAPSGCIWNLHVVQSVNTRRFDWKSTLEPCDR